MNGNLLAYGWAEMGGELYTSEQGAYVANKMEVVLSPSIGHRETEGRRIPLYIGLVYSDFT